MEGRRSIIAAAAPHALSGVKGEKEQVSHETPKEEASTSDSYDNGFKYTNISASFIDGSNSTTSTKTEQWDTVVLFFSGFSRTVRHIKLLVILCCLHSSMRKATPIFG
jgi:hypothetical protein